MESKPLPLWSTLPPPLALSPPTFQDPAGACIPVTEPGIPRVFPTRKRKVTMSLPASTWYHTWFLCAATCGNHEPTTRSPFSISRENDRFTNSCSISRNFILLPRGKIINFTFNWEMNVSLEYVSFSAGKIKMIKSVPSTIDIDRSEFRYILKRILNKCKWYLNYARDDDTVWSEIYLYSICL